MYYEHFIKDAEDVRSRLEDQHVTGSTWLSSYTGVESYDLEMEMGIELLNDRRIRVISDEDLEEMLFN